MGVGASFAGEVLAVVVLGVGFEDAALVDRDIVIFGMS